MYPILLMLMSSMNMKIASTIIIQIIHMVFQLGVLSCIQLQEFLYCLIGIHFFQSCKYSAWILKSQNNHSDLALSIGLCILLFTKVFAKPCSTFIVGFLIQLLISSCLTQQTRSTLIMRVF